MNIAAFLENLNERLWDIPVLWMILGTGLYLTIRGEIPQFRLFPAAVREFLRRLGGKEAGSSIRSLCIALAATVGTGNIAGVACAISMGGPGAVFWIWVSGILGMAVKLSEATLSVRFRSRGSDGEPLAGPMYMIREGLGIKWQPLAAAYSLFGIFAAFGVGNATQIQAVVSSLEACTAQYGMVLSPALRWTIGIGIAVGIGILVSGGLKKIGAGAAFLMPVAAAAYVGMCLTAVVVQWERLGPAIHMVFAGVFRPEAVTGGLISGMLLPLQIGIRRGVFTNEAGMGTAAMAHGCAEVGHPVQQGLMGMVEVFLDTLVICTVTALLILTSGVEIPYGRPCGAELTARALARSFGPVSGAMLCGCMCLFALATVLGWGLYAARCAEFLLGKMNWRIFAAVQAGCVLLGMRLGTGTVWVLSDLMNALMALPNLAALVLLSPEFFRLLSENLPMEKRKRMCYNRKKSIETVEDQS